MIIHHSKRLFSSLFVKKRLTKIPKHRLYILSLANGCYAFPVLNSDKTPCGIPNLVYQYWTQFSLFRITPFIFISYLYSCQSGKHQCKISLIQFSFISTQITSHLFAKHWNFVLELEIIQICSQFITNLFTNLNWIHWYSWYLYNKRQMDMSQIFVFVKM